MIPALHGQGTSLNQPALTINNATQSVSPHNTQMPQVNTQMPQALPQPFLGQPVPNDNKVYLPPQLYDNSPFNIQQPIYNNNQHYHRMSSTSEDETASNNNTWQKVKVIKKRKISRKTEPTENIKLSNRFDALPEPMEENTHETTTENKIPKPPPIFIYGVTNYEQMVDKLSEILEEEQYTTKCLADNTIKVNCRMSENYRKLVTFLKENNVIHHTYQLKEERAFRIVLKHIHHSTRIEAIQTELTKRGHQVRNIINGRHRVTKEPLNIFFID